MIFEATSLSGLVLIRPERATDERGYFSRLWCADEFSVAGRDFRPSQISSAMNTRAGTLRGMHWQATPHEETKLIRVVRGSLWDVIVDLRPSSPTHLKWLSFELTAENGQALLVPPDCAHGYITLADDTEVLYAIDRPYAPQSGRGARWNDPAFAIRWPREPSEMGERDRNWPDYRGPGR